MTPLPLYCGRCSHPQAFTGVIVSTQCPACRSWPIWYSEPVVVRATFVPTDLDGWDPPLTDLDRFFLKGIRVCW